MKKNWERQLIKILTELSEEENFVFEKILDDWILKINNSWIYGNNFEINSLSSYLIARDKVATSFLLEKENIPCMKHTLQLNKKHPAYKNTYKKICEDILNKDIPVILKDNKGFGGKNVFKACNMQQVHHYVDVLMKKNIDIAICSYVDILKEYRTVVYKGEVLLCYSKNIKRKKIENGNVIKDNITVKIEPFKNTYIERLAIKAANTINISFATVDIIKTKENLQVIEINPAVSLELFAKTNKVNYLLTKEVYRTVIKDLKNIK